MKALINKWLILFWRPLPAIITLGIMASAYFGITGSVWAVTGEFTRWGAHILQLFHVDTSQYEYYRITKVDGSPLLRTDGLLVIGMFLGCAVAALWANNVKLRMPQSKIRVIQALGGGMLAGFGARLGSGCNLANVFTGLPYFSLHTWVFTVFMVLGIFAGAKLSVSGIFKSKIKIEKISAAKNIAVSPHRQFRLFVIGSIIFIATLIWSLYLFIKYGDIRSGVKTTMLGLALLFGFGFGFILERAQICFTSAFRDLFLLGRTLMANALIIGMIISTLIVLAFVLNGVPVKLIWVGPNVVIGGFLFGFGIVMAGGCECGWMYRCVEGQVHYLIVGAGNVIGTMILALTWDYYAEAVATSWPKIYLMDDFGNYGGFFITIGLLLFSLYLVSLYSKTHFNAKAVKI